ncbi:unnamed protein product [Prorocentrum cordatum]|uniref:D-glutamate cyclase-like C-terminal domain-containing protein n=1 Tax=Prorocentrum cordatum TaxID=2364126 RepID=A0ABN9SVK8_9DINO|nr:unnamed protein product [Polarella glacialis]
MQFFGLRRIAYSPSDWERHRGGELAGQQAGYPSSGSHAGRNIELIHRRAEEADAAVSLEGAVRACLGGRARHVLVCSGFFVLHGRPCATAALGGSCETDGPLGALALVRAIACRGVRVSLFCDAHTGPVLRAGYDAMLAHFAAAGSPAEGALRRHSRCLPFVSDAGPADGPEAEDRNSVGTWRPASQGCRQTSRRCLGAACAWPAGSARPCAPRGAARSLCRLTACSRSSGSGRPTGTFAAWTFRRRTTSTRSQSTACGRCWTTPPPAGAVGRRCGTSPRGSCRPSPRARSPRPPHSRRCGHWRGYSTAR